MEQKGQKFPVHSWVPQELIEEVALYTEPAPMSEDQEEQLLPLVEAMIIVYYHLAAAAETSGFPKADDLARALVPRDDPYHS